MKRAIRLTFLALAVCGPAHALAGDALELRLQGGGGLGLVAGEVRSLRGDGEALRVGEPLYLELERSAVARLRFGVGLDGTTSSLVARGGVVLSASPGDAVTPPRADLYRFASVELELRRGQLEVGLPGEWVLELRRASVHARRCVDGSVELAHRGGSPLRLVRHLADGGREVRWLRPGAPLVLTPPVVATRGR